MATDHQPAYKQQLSALAAGSISALRSAATTDRASALEAVRAQLQRVRDAELQRLAQETHDANAEHARTITLLEQQAEAARRGHADAILKQALGEHGLPGLLTKWRADPSRAATTALRTEWLRLDSLAREQLGDPIGEHVLLAVLVDQLVRERPSALSHYANPTQAHVSARTVQSLGDWVVASDTPAALAALESLERHLLDMARVPASAVEPANEEVQVARRTSATRRDLNLALQEVVERDRARKQTAFEKSYVPPPPPRSARAAFNDGYLSRLGPGRGD